MKIRDGSEKSAGNFWISALIFSTVPRMIGANFRKKLTELTDCGDLEKQLVLMDELRRMSNHNVVLRQKFDADPEKQYNCFQYALDVPHAEEVKSILRENPTRLIFGLKFIQSLIHKSILTPRQAGSIVIYFQAGNPVHAGKFFRRENRAVSKWGIGHLWEHDLWEVPSVYGDRHEFFDSVEPEKVINEFEGFASKYISECCI